MVRPIDDIVLAWNSLLDSDDAPGWRSIPIASVGACTLRAGRSSPGREEALIAGFPGNAIPKTLQLPEGQGFQVVRINSGEEDRIWLALTRKPHGSTELFTNMVADIVSALQDIAQQDAPQLLRKFLGRIRAWQEFMRKGGKVLSPEDEIGLFGELTILRLMIDAGMAASTAVTSWVGPLDGIQDFEIGTGALEVKSTISTSGFPARVGSLEQLDDSVRQPLYVAGVRLKQVETGQRLADVVDCVRSILQEEDAAGPFEEHLLSAGYLNIHADLYTRRFFVMETRLIEVTRAFPRLIRSSVPVGILSTRYEIDLDRMADTWISEPRAVLKKLGVI